MSAPQPPCCCPAPRRSPEEAASRERRWRCHPSQRALQEIQKNQQSTGFLIPKLSFVQFAMYILLSNIREAIIFFNNFNQFLPLVKTQWGKKQSIKLITLAMQQSSPTFGPSEELYRWLLLAAKFRMKNVEPLQDECLKNTILNGTLVNFKAL
ncbi:hypothetical protein L345_02286, partial [Ophiophagus hannah]